MFLKYLIYSTVCAISFGQAIIFRPQPQPFNNNRNNNANFQRFLTPPRAMTTLNTFVPRQLIPPAPPSAAVVRFFDRPRIYTAPLTLPRVQPAPAFRRYPNNATYTLDTNTNNPRYAFNYGVADNRVITSNYRWCEVFNIWEIWSHLTREIKNSFHRLAISSHKESSLRTASSPASIVYVRRTAQLVALHIVLTIEVASMLSLNASPTRVDRRRLQ